MTSRDQHTAPIPSSKAKNARGWPGVTGELVGHGRPRGSAARRSNAAVHDAPPVECRGASGHGCYFLPAVRAGAPAAAAVAAPRRPR